MPLLTSGLCFMRSRKRSKSLNALVWVDRNDGNINDINDRLFLRRVYHHPGRTPIYSEKGEISIRRLRRSALKEASPCSARFWPMIVGAATIM